LPEASLDVQATSWMKSRTDRPREGAIAFNGASGEDEVARPKFDLQIPRRMPGSEAPSVDLPRDARLQSEIDRIYPELPPLPLEPEVQPGLEGQPFTLTDLQRIATANSPTLRQAISDVHAARGNLLQARTYPNPTVGYLVDPTNVNTTAGAQGFFVDQPIRTG